MCITRGPRTQTGPAEMVASSSGYAYGLLHEPPHLLGRVQEEALAALPGGTGPGALAGAFDRRSGASRERRLQGPRHHDGDRGFFVSWTRPPTRRPPPQLMEGTNPWTRCSSSVTAGSAARSRRPPATGDARPRRRPAAVGGPARVDVLGRPPSGTHDPARLAGADLVVEASRGDAVAANMTAALEAGCRRFVIATTGWAEDRPAVERAMRDHGATAVAASNFSLGVALFGRLVETAVALFGPLDDFDPYLLEWHRRGEARPAVRDRHRPRRADRRRPPAPGRPG